MGGVIQVLAGSVALSVVHVFIPNHWIPLVAVSRAERWTRSESAWISALTAGAHTLSTILVGVFVGLVGYKLSSAYDFVARIVAPVVLAGLGIVFVILDFTRHHSHEEIVHVDAVSRKSKPAIVTALAIAMFFSPCLEIEVYYFTAGAALGGLGIVFVSIVYVLITVLGIVILVDVGRKGVERIKLHFLEHHEKGVTGGILILLGIVTFFIRE